MLLNVSFAGCGVCVSDLLALLAEFDLLNVAGVCCSSLHTLPLSGKCGG